MSSGLRGLKVCIETPSEKGDKGGDLEYRIKFQIQIFLIINSLDSKRFGRQWTIFLPDRIFFILQKRNKITIISFELNLKLLF